MKYRCRLSWLHLLTALFFIILQSSYVLCEDTRPKPVVPAENSPADPVAIVNGVVITRGELGKASRVITAQNLTGKQLTENDILEELISTELLYQAGKKLEIKDLDRQVGERITNYRAKYPDNTAYENALKAAGLTPKELEDISRKDIVIKNLVEKEIVPKINISETEARNYYDENIDKFKHVESIRAGHILCGVDSKATAEEKKKAKGKAESLLKEIRGGKDFTELARTNSTCPDSKNGGDLGYFTRGVRPPAFDAVAFAMKPGEVSDVVETRLGYHIIKLKEKREAGAAKFDEVKEKIQDYLKKAEVRKSLAGYIARLRENAKIEKLPTG
jgi:peptidyl-prolyl cis-trans isomerase C